MATSASAREQPEHQRWRPVQQRGQRDEERLVGQRRHEQRSGGQRDAVPQVGSYRLNLSTPQIRMD
jgi:hypothetical protein